MHTSSSCSESWLYVLGVHRPLLVALPTFLTKFIIFLLLCVLHGLALLHRRPILLSGSLKGQERRVSVDRRPSNGSIEKDGSALTGPITRDEVFSLLEEKADRKDLEKRMTAVVTR